LTSFTESRTIQGTFHCTRLIDNLVLKITLETQRGPQAGHTSLQQ
jgi:hypothetical protein